MVREEFEWYEGSLRISRIWKNLSIFALIHIDMNRGSKERLTVTVDKSILEEAKKKARDKGIPVSRLVENFFSFFVNPRIYCFKCGRQFTAQESKLCPKCEWMLCPECDACRCELSEETVKAVYHMRRVYEDLLVGRVKQV